MPSSIQDLLNRISNARYGEEVRSAIHDSIEQCYSDVSASQTVADTAATAANNAAASASNASTRASSAATDASAAADTATSAASAANTAATNATSARESALTATANANTARTNANNAATTATNAATNATNAATAANTAAGRAESAATSANSAASSANTAASDASAAATDATNSADACDSARSETLVATQNANAATTRANNAAYIIENLTVSSENVPSTEEAEASYSTVDSHGNIHFKLRQGAPGTPFRIIGRAYADLEALEAGVPSPAVGDMYNVGSAAPYDIYRWTGDTWENQGNIGSATVEELTNAEIDTLWSGSAISSPNSKYMNHTGFLYFIVNKIKAAFNTKVDKVAGKVLSSNDFTNAYISQIESNTSNVSVLTSGKVDKISGKGLSTNDFTTAYKNNVDRVNTLVGTTTLQTTADTLTAAINELKATLTPISFTVQLDVSSWSNGAQSVTDSRFITSGYDYEVAPASSSHEAYGASGIYADEITVADTLTFHCASVPAVDLTVNVKRTVTA